LIRRACNEHDRHSNQIALPGGAQQANESIEETALRETEEEIGVGRSKMRIFGTLSSLYVPPSNFLVTPVVAAVGQRPHFRCHANEVSELLEVPLALLLDPIAFRLENRLSRGVKCATPLYQLGPVRVFGATAMILSEFSTMLARARQ
jgi:8-oxo-dGTP pyrophosphatase MutT (NUDIX family)